MKRATAFISIFTIRLNISIHALVKRATFLLHEYEHNGKDFNPRPREEGDFVTGLIVAFGGSISIHALVKRATEQTAYRLQMFLFQSTPS